MSFIKELKLLGCQFALDDFGTGMSSFAYLKALPVDYLKIDGRFIEDMVDDPTTHAIVESINHIGHVMGMQTIAEYVGSVPIREKLQKWVWTIFKDMPSLSPRHCHSNFRIHWQRYKRLNYQ